MILSTRTLKGILKKMSFILNTNKEVTSINYIHRLIFIFEKSLIIKKLKRHILRLKLFMI